MRFFQSEWLYCKSAEITKLQSSLSINKDGVAY